MSLEHLDCNITPDEAYGRLREIGVSEEAIPLLAQEGGLISHELQALASIYLSGSTGNLKDAYLEARSND